MHRFSLLSKFSRLFNTPDLNSAVKYREKEAQADVRKLSRLTASIYQTYDIGKQRRLPS